MSHTYITQQITNVNRENRRLIFHQRPPCPPFQVFNKNPSKLTILSHLYVVKKVNHYLNHLYAKINN